MRQFQVLDWRSYNHPLYSPYQPYEEFIRAQDYIWEQRLLTLVPDMLIVTYHPPTITLGSRPLKKQIPHIRPVPKEWLDEYSESYNPEKEQKLFDRARALLQEQYNIQLVRSPRGGSVWYHDKGVLQLYVIAELTSEDHFVSEIIDPIEETLYEVVRHFLPNAYLVPNARKDSARHNLIGVWVNDKKIGAIGVKIGGHNKRRITQFGASLNLNPDTRNMALIDPCGIEGKESTSLQKEWGKHELTFDWVLGVLYQKFKDAFKTELQVPQPTYY